MKTAARPSAANRAKPGRIPTKETPTFASYAEGWWTPEHEYVGGRLARGASMSPTYLDVKRIYLNKHILPTLGDKKLARITPRMIEDWLLGLIVTPKERTIPTVAELKVLFREDQIETIWGDERHYAINLSAASTGMRMGECQALQVQHVHPNYVAVVHSWARKHRMEDPKWNIARETPIPAKASRYLSSLIESSAFNGPADLVFHGRNRNTPLGHKEIPG